MEHRETDIHERLWRVSEELRERAEECLMRATKHTRKRIEIALRGKEGVEWLGTLYEFLETISEWQEPLKKS